MKYLNLGCGSRFHPDWTNLDMIPTDQRVKAHDLRQRLPFENESFDLVYHSHLLEHLPRDEISAFMQECRRVLKIGGIIRIAIPNLEDIVKTYLASLERALRREPGADNNYDWIMIELYDQTVREQSGGAMLEYMRRDPIPNEEFVLGRMGGEARRILHEVRAVQARVRPSQWERAVSRMSRLPDSLRHAIVKTLLTREEQRALKIGRFRLAGEVHQWMYDRYSLARILIKAGFDNPMQRTAVESAIPNWKDFHLDTESDGTICKPDSLYMEARRPGS